MFVNVYTDQLWLTVAHTRQCRLGEVGSYGSWQSHHEERTSCHSRSRCQGATAGLLHGCPESGLGSARRRPNVYLASSAGNTLWWCNPADKGKYHGIRKKKLRNLKLNMEGVSQTQVFFFSLTNETCLIPMFCKHFHEDNKYPKDFLISHFDRCMSNFRFFFSQRFGPFIMIIVKDESWKLFFPSNKRARRKLSKSPFDIHRCRKQKEMTKWNNNNRKKKTGLDALLQHNKREKGDFDNTMSAINKCIHHGSAFHAIKEIFTTQHL